VSHMDKLLIIPIILVAAYFLYRHIRKSIKGECHGNCTSCSRELMEKTHGDQSVDAGK